MTYVLIMVDKEGACSEVPASWQITPGVKSFGSSDIRQDETSSNPGGVPSMRGWPRRYWDLAGQLVGAGQLRSRPAKRARASLRALVFLERKRLLANVPDDLVDRIIEVGAVMIYEER